MQEGWGRLLFKRCQIKELVRLASQTLPFLGISFSAKLFLSEETFDNIMITVVEVLEKLHIKSYFFDGLACKITVQVQYWKLVRGLPPQQLWELDSKILRIWSFVQFILFEIDCAIFYTNLHELFSQFISWTNWANSCKFMDNWWISCQGLADMEKFYDDLIIINLYLMKTSCGLFPDDVS